MEQFEGQQQLYELSIDKMIQQIDAIDWSDISESPQATIPDNPFFQTKPPQQYLRYYQLFRALLNNQEVSQRSYTLTTLILRLKSTNYYALMLRSRYFFSKQNSLESVEKEIYFANCLLSLNAKEYQIWTYKKQLFKKYSNLAQGEMYFYHPQSQFLDYLLDQDSKNYHVWDYKLWLTLYFGQEEKQIEYTENVLFRGNKTVEQLRQQFEGTQVNVEEIDWRNCYSLWSYRYNLRESFSTHKTGEDLKKFESNEIAIIREWISKKENLANECGWNYLIGLVIGAKSSTKQLLREFTGIALNIFATSKNRFAGDAIIQLTDELQTKYGEKLDNKKEIILELKTCDKVRKLYYEYLLEEN